MLLKKKKKINKNFKYLEKIYLDYKNRKIWN